MSDRVLVIEDEAIVRGLIVEVLEDAGFETVEADRADAGLELLSQNSVSLVISDIVMPGLSGSRAARDPSAPPTRAFRSCSSPGPAPTGTSRRRWRTARAGSSSSRSPTRTSSPPSRPRSPGPARRRTSCASGLSPRPSQPRSPTRSRRATSKCTATANGSRCSHSRSPSGSSCRRTSTRPSVSAPSSTTSGRSASPTGCSSSPTRFPQEETALIRAHPLIGDRLLEPLDLLDGVRAVVRHHHERWDGAGYPDGLAGEQIPTAARIVGVADAVEAMSANRPYRKALRRDAIVRELTEGRATQWDSAPVDVALDLIRTGGARLRGDRLQALRAGSGRGAARDVLRLARGGRPRTRRASSAR